MFLDLKHAWNDVPFDVVNDGDVTALLGSMSVQGGGVLGIALGTSTAGGFVTADGRITPWLNEIAFVPIDYRSDAPRDEWSGDVGCVVQYLSQQAVGRLLAPAEIRLSPELSLPAKLKVVQSLMRDGDPRARDIYQTLGVYLGYALPQFAPSTTTATCWCSDASRQARAATSCWTPPGRSCAIDFPELASRLDLRMPGEHEKRHGQAIAAASLPDRGETAVHLT